MPYSGGTYSAPSSPGAFNPATGGQQATPAAWNTLLTDICAALSTCVLKDGTQAVTADIPFGGHKLTGVANGSAAQDAATVGQVAAGALNGANDTGSANVYVITPAQAVAAYAVYQTFQFKASNTNTGTSTLAVSGLAAKTIKHATGTDLLASDIIAGQIVEVVYDGTNFQLVSATALRGTASTWRAAQAFAATVTMSGAALNEAARVDVASAATCDIGAAASNYVRITGTTNITALGTASSGARRHVVFAGALGLFYNATSLILPNGILNITTAAGDCALFESEGSGNWRCLDYQRKDGTALQGYAAPQSATAYGTYSGGVVTIRKGSGIASIVETATGRFTVTMSPAMPDANYLVLFTTRGGVNLYCGENSAASRTTTQFRLFVAQDGVGAADPDALNIQVLSLE